MNEEVNRRTLIIPKPKNFKEIINDEKISFNQISSSIVKDSKDEEKSIITDRSNLYLQKNKGPLILSMNNSTYNNANDETKKINLELEGDNRKFQNKVNDSQNINMEDFTAKAEKVENMQNKLVDDASKDKITAKKLVFTKKQKVKVTCKSILMSLFCPKNCLNAEIQANNNSYQMFYKELNKLLELDSILDCKKNIDLLKILLFNKNQQKAIDYVEFEFKNNEIDSHKDIEAIRNYFITKKGNLHEKDLKILELLNNDIFLLNEVHDYHEKSLD